MSDKVFPAGTLILREGERGGAAYFIKSGKVEIYRTADGQKVSIHQYGAGRVLGEMEIIDDQPCLASVVALEPTTCLVITRDAFAQAFSRAAPLLQCALQTEIDTVITLSGSRKRSGAVVANALASMGRSSEVLNRKVYDVGRQIVTQGQPGNLVYLIQSGLVELSRTGADGTKQVMAQLGAGALFGETELLVKGPYAVTATTLASTACVVIPGHILEKLMSEAAPILRAMQQSYIEAVRNGHAPRS